MTKRAEVVAVMLGIVVFAPRLKDPQQPEATALATLRSVMAAESTYAAVSGGHFGTPACLATVTCLPGPSRPTHPFVDPRFAEAFHGGRVGYRFFFLAGPEAEQSAVVTSGSALSRFAVIAEPITQSASYRTFCVDDRGEIYSTDRNVQPMVDTGRCVDTSHPIR